MNANKNNELALMGLILSPAFIPDQDIESCASFREAVCLAWDRRRVREMTRGRLAELCGLLPQHLSDYLDRREHNPKGQRRRSLPAEKIASFEAVVGNRAITQFLVRQVQLTLMEEVLEKRKSA